MARYLQGARGHPRGRAADAPPPDSPGNRSLGHLELAPWQHVNRHPVEERQRRVINRLLDGFAGFLTTSKYAAVATCSADTALRDIGGLVSRGILVRNPGGGRSTSYRLATAAELAAEPPPS